MEKNSFDDFLQRFVDLQNEAKGYNVQSVIVLVEYDPINECEMTACRRTMGPTYTLGLLKSAEIEFTREIVATIEDATD